MSTFAAPQQLLTLRDAAWLIGTDSAALSRYSTGKLAPGRRSADRLAALNALTPESKFLNQRHPMRMRRMNTLPSLAVSLRRELRETGTIEPTWALQRISEALGRLRTFPGEDCALILTEPSTTGSAQWDTMLAGAARYWCDRLDMPRPPWTDVASLRELWIPVPETAAWARRDPLPELLDLNILLTRNGLDKA